MDRKDKWQKNLNYLGQLTVILNKSYLRNAIRLDNLIITVHPKRLGQPSKNISVLTVFLFETFGDEHSVTFSIQNVWHCPTPVEVIFSTEDAI
jgi:hypothetical protein